MPSVFEKGDILSDRIRLIELFDSGGQAEIWRVEDMDFPNHSNLALKLRYIPWEDRSDREFRTRDARLEYEVDLLGSSNSIHIVQPHFKIEGKAEFRGERYAHFGLVMDFAPEGSLEKFFGSAEFSSYLPLERVRLLEQMALGVQAMQHFKIYHNDIKPKNILIFREGNGIHPRFADFGYAFRKTEPPVYGGTGIYMAPELVLKEADPSFKTDVFSLGLVFYETMMGFHPLIEIVKNRDPIKALQGYYSTDNYIDFSDAHRKSGKDLVELIERMCARDPKMRPEISEVIEQLRKIIQSDPYWNTPNLGLHFPDLIDRYRWVDSLHHLFGEQEVLVFLRGGNREADAKALAEWLKAEKLFGFTIMRLLGEYNDLLRVWRRPSDRGVLDGLLKRFEAERGPYLLLEPKLHWPLSPPSDRLGLKQQSDGLALLDDVAAGRSMMRRRGSIIAGETKSHREKDKTNKAIRAICRAVATTPLTSDLAEVIGEKIHSQLSKMRVFSEVEVFVDPGSRGIMAEFVIILESQQFHRFPDVLDVLEKTLKTLSAAPPSRTVTHFEMDKTAAFESYDGRLIYELFKFSRARLNEQ
ncbi:protein kinase [Novosphingobium sp. G106]|uniref:protein kinase domain-containing protein n=1 Tax=Novosphingobium sp. G106 TaxID=2849500 RepID=UPI001C2DA629|nr:protein kinase [Novosphingobium sp. G106]MBV1686404.1 protein kinase [Novosphingobium sp. G106]